MTVHRFPRIVPPEAEAVAAARGILRSAAPHTDETLTLACMTLQQLGDGVDYMEADRVLYAISLRKPKPTPVAVKVAVAVIGFALAVWLCVEIGAGIMRASLEIGALAEAAEVAARW